MIAREKQAAKCVRKAMTLVELMVAVALSALLLSALVGVLRGVDVQSKMAVKLDRPVWPSRVIDLVRRDLIAATAIWAESNTVWIRTDAPSYKVHGLGDRESAGTRRVGYRCRVLPGGDPVLERVDAGRSSVLAIAPTRIIVERLDSVGAPQPLPLQPGPVPQQVRVWIYETDSNSPTIVKDVVTR